MLYFSGTGNSEYIAKRFAEIMREEYKQDFEVHSIEEDKDFRSILEMNSIAGFCYPTYGSCVPRIMREFVLKHKEYLRGKKLIIFCTQLIFSGDGAGIFTELLGDIPYEVVLAEHFNMPNNLCNIPVFRVRNGSETDSMVKRAEVRLEKACGYLNQNRKHLRGFNSLSYLLGLIQRPSFSKIEKAAADKVYVDEMACSLCGRCARECPTHNLYISEEMVRARGICTQCYRCVNNCPQQAITVWINRRVTKQYHGINRNHE